MSRRAHKKDIIMNLIFSIFEIIIRDASGNFYFYISDI